ncbi:MAG: RND transporter, partial [Acinetobacter sp.]
MLFKQHKIALALCLSTILVGCSAVVKTPYNAPTVQVPQQFQYDTQKNKNVNLTDQWWTLFNDTQLNQLVEQVLAKNSDLTVAGITLQQA